MAYIDANRDRFGVESICRALPIAPSTYHHHHRQQLEPTRRSTRARRDDPLRPEIQRVWDENHQVYGPRKVWQQLKRGGFRVARCTVGRLMTAMGLRGAVRGRAWITTTHDGGLIHVRRAVRLALSGYTNQIAFGGFWRFRSGLNR